MGKELKHSKKKDHAVLVFTKGNWGKGRSIEQACKNCPGYKTNQDIIITVVHLPEGCAYCPEDDEQSAYDAVWVDNYGRTHYPQQAAIIHTTSNPIQVRKVS